ncbi:phage scaffolding protein [Clostridium botulinum]|uniref:phage scaffolding protein n=1 Tax=Clostridium botulinum TaxID=1491 RepID=UPI0009B2EE0B|nr:phage scaffolding protein [Clostridium botulinum]NFG21973.1 viral A-type inclusion protein [Clostridium botulinum]NFO82529.1 viral A-type inclusion protein [Clostridium botulinum]NFS12788.1 viral A-type inclusion protein [Clostridium botulinum]
MKREEIKSLLGDGNISDKLDAIINKIMDMNGSDIEKQKKEVENLGEKNKNLEAELTTNKQTLDEANAQIEKFKSMDIEGIKAGAEDWKTKYETAQTEAQQAKEKFEADMKAKDYDYAVNNYFNGFKFVDDVVKETVVNQFKAKEFKLEENKFLGADEFMKDYQEQHKALFVQETQEQQPQFTNKNPGGGGNSQKKMSLAEAMKLKNENPNAEINFD